MNKVLVSIVLLLISVFGYSQANPKPIFEVITNPNGSFTTWTFLPQHYDPSKKYPFLLFVPGSGEIRTGTRSTDSVRMRKYGPGSAIMRGKWDGKGLVRNANGSIVDTSFIVSIMQPPSVSTSRINGSRISDSIIVRYSVDSMRLGWTGLSMGGQMGNQVLMTLGNQLTPAINWDHITWWSSAFIFSTPEPTSGAARANLQLWLDKGGFYYYGIGANDGGAYIRKKEIDSLNLFYPGQVVSYEYPNEDHCCWNTRYDRPSLYDSIFLRDKYPKAHAEDLIQTNGSSVVLHGSVAGYAAVAQWSFVSGPNTPTIVPAGDTTATVSNLVNGTYKIKLRARNGYGASASYYDWETTIEVAANFNVIKKNYRVRKHGRKMMFKVVNP